MSKKTHMAKWLYTEKRYATWCQSKNVGDFFIVRRDSEWNQVDCKKCLQKFEKSRQSLRIRGLVL